MGRGGEKGRVEGRGGGWKGVYTTVPPALTNMKSDPSHSHPSKPRMRASGWVVGGGRGREGKGGRE